MGQAGSRKELHLWGWSSHTYFSPSSNLSSSSWKQLPDSHGESLFLCASVHLVWVVLKLSSRGAPMSWWSKPISSFTPFPAVIGSGAGTWPNGPMRCRPGTSARSSKKKKESVKILSLEQPSSNQATTRRILPREWDRTGGGPPTVGDSDLEATTPDSLSYWISDSDLSFIVSLTSLY